MVIQWRYDASSLWIAYLFFNFTVSFNADKFVPGVVDNFRDFVFCVTIRFGVVYLPSWIAQFSLTPALLLVSCCLRWSLLELPAAIVAVFLANDHINALVSRMSPERVHRKQQISTKSAFLSCCSD